MNSSTHSAVPCSVIVEPAVFGTLLRAIDRYEGKHVVRAALQIKALAFARNQELVCAEWQQVDWDACEWRFPIHKVRNGEHIVPLSSQAVNILRQLQPLTGSGRYTFQRPRKADANAVLTALQNMDGLKDEFHFCGYRSAVRTMLEDILHERPEVIDLQFGHLFRDASGRSNSCAAFLPERRKMMQKWADFCDQVKAETPNS